MTRNTIIREKHQTPAGEVSVEIAVSVSGPGDGVAVIDQDLIEHIKEQRPQSIADPIDSSQTSGNVQFFAPVVEHSFGGRGCGIDFFGNSTPGDFYGHPPDPAAPEQCPCGDGKCKACCAKRFDNISDFGDFKDITFGPEVMPPEKLAEFANPNLGIPYQYFEGGQIGTAAEAKSTPQ